MEDWQANIVFPDYAPSADWMSRCESICNAPVAKLRYEDLDPDHPAAQFKLYWDELRGAEPAPARKDLRPNAIKPLLKWLFIFERTRGTSQAPRYQVRLQGTAVCDMCHGNYQGSYLDEFTSTECYGSRAEMFAHAIKTVEPQYAKVMPSITATGTVRSEYRLDVVLGAFPFYGPDGEISQIVVAVAPRSEDMRLCL